jgi:hypothetical protein
MKSIDADDSAAFLYFFGLAYLQILCAKSGHQPSTRWWWMEYRSERSRKCDTSNSDIDSPLGRVFFMPPSCLPQHAITLQVLHHGHAKPMKPLPVENSMETCFSFSNIVIIVYWLYLKSYRYGRMESRIEQQSLKISHTNT